MTKREMLNKIATVNASDAEIVAFVKHEIELLDKKNTYASKRASKKQEANESIKDAILNVLTNSDKAMTATEIATAIDVSVNKASALLTQLKEDNSVTREVIKRKAYFSVD